MRKILLTGKNGQVGWELQRALATLGVVVAVDRREMDLANPDSIRHCIREVKPDLIVNAAAYTAVDKAESEADLAMAINGIAPGIMAEEAKRQGAAIIHYSTDYVFDGKKNAPYTEQDDPEPLNGYGKTKLAGERAIQAGGAPHLIFRTSWVYGLRGKNFLLTVLRLAQERDEMKIVDDQIGAPTWSRMIADASARILAQIFSPIARHPAALAEVSGIYHLTAGGKTSWHGFASAILTHRCAGPAPDSLRWPRLVPITTAEYPLPAARPGNSLLSNDKLMQTFALRLPDWDESLAQCMDGG